MLRLLHLCDSLFPIGGYAYSDGLETAAASGAITGVAGLGGWLDVALDETIGRLEGPSVWRAFAAFSEARWDVLAEIDAELTAVRPSSSARRSSRAMGWRLLTTWGAMYPDSRFEEMQEMSRRGAIGPTLPVAFASACASADIDPCRTIEGYAYTRLSSTVSAAMRLMPIGQTDAHTALARVLDRVPAIVSRIVASDRAPEAFTPAADIAAMNQQHLHSRLFRS